ncbi:hypothetical protein ebA2729 [Aromatoleum aromaticum EbN1]|uniref:Uncharacterized protein n=1 Tax=Aromatoleum aromaticum (strain DSM 19018 / LMG 30748 / EbN1) TaxID=76114 RepID=Q5P4V4_AROAE|nr:hypothetical protein ebA2729 [Aromatoleum aromaticum EbN1]
MKRGLEVRRSRHHIEFAGRRCECRRRAGRRSPCMLNLDRQGGCHV